jgi:hypothetical protein
MVRKSGRGIRLDLDRLRTCSSLLFTLLRAATAIPGERFQYTQKNGPDQYIETEIEQLLHGILLAAEEGWAVRPSPPG